MIPEPSPISNSDAANDVAEAVTVLRQRGFAVCKPDPGGKSPTERGWPTRSKERDDFGPGDQVGIMGDPLSDGGRAGHSLVIVDLDAAAAVVRGDDFLPATGMVEGRPGKPRSHRYHLVPNDSIPSWAVSTATQAAPAAKAVAGHAGPFLKHFAHAETKQGLLDLIGTGGQVVCPPSLHGSGGRREWEGGEPGVPAVVDFLELWAAVCDLALACGGTVPVVERPSVVPAAGRPRSSAPTSDVERRALAYLARLPEAVSGQGGHSRLYYAARAMVYGFDLGRDLGFQLLRNHYNPRCNPPWPDADLQHKVHDADSTMFSKPRGWLRDAGQAVGNGYTYSTNGRTTTDPGEPDGFDPGGGHLHDLPDLPDGAKWEEVIPLGEAPPPEPFPVDVLPKPLALLAAEASAALNCPPDFIGTQVLCMAGGAIGNARRLAITGTHTQSAALYLGVVSRPGSGKSPAFSLLRQPFVDAQARMLAEWKSAADAWQKEEPDRRGPKPVPRRCLMSDATTESAKAVLAENGRGVLMAVDELSGLVASLNQYKSGRGNDRQFYLSAWAGDSIVCDRRSDRDKNGGPAFVPHPFLAIVGGVQPAVLDRMNGDHGAGDGWLDRFLWSYPADLPARGERWQEVSPDTLGNWRDVVDKLLLLPMAEGDGQSRAYLLKLTAEGSREWQAFTEGHAAELNDGRFPDHLREPWSKLTGYCGRLALIVHLLRWACGDVESQDVDGESMARARRLVGYFKNHAKRAMAVIGGDPKAEDAKKVWAWVVRERRVEFKLWEAHKDLQSAGRFPTVESLDPAIALLVRHNYIRVQPTDPPKGPGRRPAPTCEVNPSAKGPSGKSGKSGECPRSTLSERHLPDLPDLPDDAQEGCGVPGG
jgi:hypothetical protein